MKTERDIKKIVEEKYSAIARQNSRAGDEGCCGSKDEKVEVFDIMADDYGTMAGYTGEADLGLGCGLPTKFARIQKGDTVIDLGSGAGNDCFIARHECGPEGRVIGVDFSRPMIDRARTNARKLKFDNVEFLYGDIEDLPVDDGIADVVVSNCVLNLVPDKARVFSEILRVLRPGAHFSISDIVSTGDLPEGIKEAAELYAGCVAGAIPKQEYLDLIRQTGFVRLKLQKDKPIEIPEEILAKYLSPEDIELYRKESGRIHSISVYAEKPSA